MTRSAFALLDPVIQQALYRMRWTELRPIQSEAIISIMEGENHLIISANTAAGKTEAAFLPIISKIVAKETAGIGAVYVGPLKALINDQFRRLELLCESAEISVFKWHGDVGSEKKRRFLADPSGILLITPESIESLFINHSQQLPALFANLPFVVIDEMHAFVGTERGMHLRSLLARIQQVSASPIRIIGLSATIGDPSLARAWLIPDNPDSVRVIEGQDSGRELSYLVRGYLIDDTEKDEESGPELTRIAEDVIKYFYGKKSLVFINSRSNLELYTDHVRRTVEREGIRDLFRIHHGSLSKAEREDTETALKSSMPVTTFCSSTLELGIDVGDVERVGQIGAPWSVSSLRQRLGRSGRKEQAPSVMIMFIPERRKAEGDLVARLHLQLLRAIALSDLLLEGWCEPPCIEHRHLSTFVQQILSVVKERGGVRVPTLHRILVERGAFSSLSHQEFLQILKAMGAADLIEQDAQGLLILGIVGENIVKNVEFYAVFSGRQEIDVISEGRRIGSISYSPGIEPQTHLILAGRRWEVVSVDLQRQEILVKPSRGGRAPNFVGDGGADLHPVVAQRMRQTLFSDSMPVYLDKQGKEILSGMRTAAREAGLAERDLIPDSNGTWWFTWAGSAVQRTLVALGRSWGEFEIADHEIAIFFKGASADTITDFYVDTLQNCPSASEIAICLGDFVREKYDRYLPEQLLVDEFARGYIDTDGASPPRIQPPSERT